ncbi:MAG TPA: B12-binding domain-containing protein [Puia sp.]
MSGQEIESKVIALTDSEAIHERLVNELIACMIDLEIEAFERILDGFILTRSIDLAITQILFPFLNRIGILWLTNHIHPAQEHLVSNVIRQKLIAGIEGRLTRRSPGKTVVLFLPEGEHHELGLLYVYYLLKAHGAKVLYLGADVPQSDLEFLCQARRPDCLYTHLTGIAGSFQLDKFLTQLTQRIDIPLVISGELARTQLRKITARVNFRRDIGEVLDFVGTL